MILIDTAPLVALCDRGNGRHSAAARELGAMSGETFGTCEAVLAETHFHLGRPAQRQRLRVVMKDLRLAVLPDRAIYEWYMAY
ncbi:MAG: PIN domain-containing protein [Vicinamibacterales bacterium]